MITDDSFSPEERDALLKEHRTWQLLRTVLEYVETLVPSTLLIIFRNRLQRASSDFYASSASTQLAENPYIPPEDLTQYIVDESDELSLFAVSLCLFNEGRSLIAGTGGTPPNSALGGRSARHRSPPWVSTLHPSQSQINTPSLRKWQTTLPRSRFYDTRSTWSWTSWRGSDVSDAPAGDVVGSRTARRAGSGH